MSPKTYNLRDRILGAYMGSVAGDALGGPVEGWHADMIVAVLNGHVTGFLPYLRDLHPGYALQATPGAITDDTFIKHDFAAFFLAHPDEADRTPMALAEYLLANAHFEYWWPPAVVPLRKIESGEMTPEETRTILMGGGAAWWTPIGLIHAGDPAAAYAETARLSIIWRQPFEQNLIAATQAAVAASVLPDATVGTVSRALLQFAGPRACKLILRAQRIAGEHVGDLDGLIRGIYAEALVTECTGELNGPLPPSAAPTNPYRGASVLWAEQIPLAFAALIFGKGDFRDTMLACASLGRDADSIASTVGSWIGGLVGLHGMPEGWVDTLQGVNLQHMDLLERANRLADMALG